MKRLSAIFLPAILALLASSCTNVKSPTDPSTVTDTGSVQFIVSFRTVPAAPGLRSRAPASDFVTGTITLTKGTSTVNASITISGSRATATVSALAAGTWTAEISFFNAAGDLTYTGTTTVVVRNGVTTPVSVVVTPVGGSVSIDFPLPLDDGSAWVGDYLSYNLDGTVRAETARIDWSGSVIVLLVQGIYVPTEGEPAAAPAAAAPMYFEMLNESECFYPSEPPIIMTRSADGSRIDLTDGRYLLRQ